MQAGSPENFTSQIIRQEQCHHVAQSFRCGFHKPVSVVLHGRRCDASVKRCGLCSWFDTIYSMLPWSHWIVDAEAWALQTCRWQDWCKHVHMMYTDQPSLNCSTPEGLSSNNLRTPVSMQYRFWKAKSSDTRIAFQKKWQKCVSAGILQKLVDLIKK